MTQSDTLKTMGDPTEKIKDVYIDSLIHGALTTTKSVTKTSKGGTIESIVQKRTVVPKNCLEYLRTKVPEEWSPPAPVPQVIIKNETLNTALAELRQMLVPIEGGYIDENYQEENP